MKRLIVFGRGRSGTTVLADELSHHPEVNLSMGLAEFEGFSQFTIEPFLRAQRPRVSDALDQLKASSCLLPYDWWTMREGLDADAAQYDRYLDELESVVTTANCQWVGFKIIDNQFDEREGLLAVLAERGYHVVNIRRQNLLRHALSGLVARQRGVYNRRDYELPDETYNIDPRELLEHMRDIVVSTEDWDHTLADHGMPVIRTVYEEFLADRAEFFQAIFGFLGIEIVDLPKSNFTKMVPLDLSEIISNLGELQATAHHLGMETSLAEA
jgi:LPS sulfotransferase NodH